MRLIIIRLLIIAVSLCTTNYVFAQANFTGKACVVLGKSYRVTVKLRHGTFTKTVVAGRQASGTPANSGFAKGCMGRCGAGCGSDAGQGNYALDCLKHDVCTFYDKDFGGAFDRDCGNLFRAASNDTITIGRSPCWKSKEQVARALGWGR